MEGRENTLSGSPKNIGSDSPISGLVPQGIERSVERSIVGGEGVVVGSGEGSNRGSEGTGKRKRGRPRKYDPDRTMPSASPPNHALPNSPDIVPKRGRGRPRASGLGGVVANSFDGSNFTPHVLIINAGEDIVAKILSFCQMGPQAVCVLSANGSISSVIIRQPSSSGGFLTYEGHFEILSLTGSFAYTETGGSFNRTGGLSVSLATPDGHVVGGAVGGFLVAATPVQAVLGSFMPTNPKVKKGKRFHEPPVLSAVPIVAPAVADVAATPTSGATPDGDNNIVASPTSTLPEQTQTHQGVEAEENSTSSGGALKTNSHSSKNVCKQTGSQSSSDHHNPSPDLNIDLGTE